MVALFTTEEASVTVTKHIETDGDTVEIGLRINSSREQSVTARVLDTVPTTVSVQTPTTDPSRWSVSEGTVAYERSLAPDASVTTGYTFSCENDIDLSDSHQPPALTITDRVAYDETGATSTTEVSADVEGYGEFAMPDDEVSVTEMVAEPTPDGDSHSAGSSTTADGSKISGTDQFETASDDEVSELVGAILDTLDADASAAQRNRLAQELEDIAGPRSSLELRVMHLQSQFQDLTAYIDAMEAFLDDHGAAEDILTEVLDELHVVRGELESVHDEQIALDSRIETVEDRTNQLEGALESHADVAESELRQLEDRLEAVETTQQTVQSQLKEFAEFQDAFQEVLQGESSNQG